MSFTVDIYAFDPAIEITSDPDTVFLGQTSQLIVNQPLSFDFVWTASTGEIVAPVGNPIVTPTANTTYCVTVTDDHGCTGVACIAVSLNDLFCDERDIFVPNAFSPNSDGENDEFIVRTQYALTDIEMRVFNRWGEQVFSTSTLINGWNGTVNGKEVQPDVFGYFIKATCPNGEKFFKKGNVTLFR